MNDSSTGDPARYAADVLRAFARDLLCRAGLPEDRAGDVAGILVDADLMGHDTHGLNLLPSYLEHLGSGAMAAQGEPVVVSERPAVATWDGGRLPGAWLVLRAMDNAMARARIYGMGTVTVRHSHHIGCLSAYLHRATAQGFVMLLFSSAPGGGSVAPFGGRRALFSPSPMAMGCPTQEGPILVDISTSTTTNNNLARLRRQGLRLPQPWLLDEEGRPSDDPAVVLAPRQGSVLPLGGLDTGHKGYGLALMVEALTAGLTQHGRHQPCGRFANTVFLQILDPEAFGGLAGFRDQMQRIALACRDNPPRPGVQQVLVPGDKGMRRRQAQLAGGVALAPGILDALLPWADRLAVVPPPTLHA